MMKRKTAWGILWLLLGAWVSLAAQEKAEQKPWLLSPNEIRSVVSKVRAGKDLTPAIWPKGAKVAVALSFDFDAETNALRDSDYSPGVLSQGEYAAAGCHP